MIKANRRRFQGKINLKISRSVKTPFNKYNEVGLLYDLTWYKIDAKNGKSVMKLVRTSSLRPLTFKCVILERFESLKNLRELCGCWMAKLCHSVAVFHINLSKFFSIKITVKSLT